MSDTVLGNDDSKVKDFSLWSPEAQSLVKKTDEFCDGEYADTTWGPVVKTVDSLTQLTGLGPGCATN